MLDDEPLLFRVFPFRDGCLIGTAALGNLATPVSEIAPYLASLSSPFTTAMLDFSIVTVEKTDGIGG